ncbi:glycoside hydrolase family 2 TIM barrel-domain containing protein [Flammeovirga sp. SubArs3]|uniref:glycoside hydrolase family 2 TIM barrel-domain containing protein n=1 Tax=Flammeovirga sp. SubArs3 TaxID=2995316 RepID=UPI00248B9E33|nr:glycoside hydrolase family 2 TIM barrel-domain containing protein [Flammeovirga sp. SubArs3]
MRFYLISILICIGLIGCQEKKANLPQRNNDFNFDWEFALLNVDQADLQLNEVPKTKWEEVRLPHDWVIEHDYDSANAEFAPATGYIYGGGIGWYKKNFHLSLTKNQKAFILFDGVYNKSEVYLNGKKLGFHPYGYSPFYYDLTPYLQSNKENTIAVKVDHRNYADSRWYTGAGIYRNVELIVTDKLHIPVWGSFITTPEVSKEKALVQLKTDINNGYSIDKNIEIVTEIYNQDGKFITKTSDNKLIKANSTIKLNQQVNLTDPELWDVDNPKLYLAKTKLVVDNGQVDELVTNFGVRNIRFDADSGFFLNGQNMKIKGVCLHHDAGLVGTAVPKDVWRRRLEVLKEGGCNAIRVAHNPASNEFLDLCDELGFLVQDEFFDEWDYPKDKRWNQKEQSQNFETEGYTNYFQEYAESDLKSVILSHRNHPSVFQWSIGNEIEWTYPRISKATGFFGNMNWNGNYFWSKSPYSREEIKNELDRLPKQEHTIGNTAEMLVKWTKEMDLTRPVTANCILPSASHETKYGQSLDIVGYSYRRVLYDYGHENYPDKVIMGTENLAQYHEWKAIMDRPFIAGTFFWTGINYLGEIRANWPAKGNDAGMVDFAGFPKPSYHMIKTLWSDKPHTFIATQSIEKSINKLNKKGELVAKNPEAWKTALWEWHDVNNHWNYSKGQMISVELYSNSEEIELFLNGKSLGVKTLDQFEDHIYKWAVPFEKGELSAIGKKGGITTETKLVTAGEPEKVKLTLDKRRLENDRYEVAHVVAQLVDGQGNPVRHEERIINFDIPQYLRVLGVDNGAVTNIQNHTLRKIETDKGRALLVLQSTKDAVDVEVKATVDGLSEDKILLTIGDDKEDQEDVFAELN